MKVITYETLYHEDHGATLKHKCGKRIVTLSLLSFSLIFLFIFFLFGPSFFASFIFLFFIRSLIPTCGGIIVSIILSSLGKCSNNDDHHTLFTLQLKNYNSILRTKYDSMWMPPAVYRDVQWCMNDMYEELWTVALPQIRCQLHDHASNMTMMKRVIITKRWKVAWQYISEWLWKCHNR